MSKPTWDLSRYAPPPGKRDYPRNCVVGTVMPESAEPIVAAVTAAGMADDAIAIVTPDRWNDNDLTEQEAGWRGIFQRAISSAFGDMDYLKDLSSDLDRGRLIMEIQVGRDADRRARVAEILRGNGAWHINYLSWGSIEGLLDNETTG